MIFEKTRYQAISTDFCELQERRFGLAFFLGIGIITASIFLGRSYAFYIGFLVFSVLITLIWRNAPHPWTFLVSISAATPITISRKQFPCNLIFAIWFIVFNIRYLSKVPKWIYVPFCLVAIGFVTSSINWMSGDVLRNLMHQGALAYNFILGPFLLLPIVYLRMRESRDNVANLRGLLFFLIVPSTLILISAKVFGTVANLWEASLHVEDFPEGFFIYKLGKIFVDLSMTGVGFILAALICASTAIAVSQVKGLYRLLAGAC